MKLILKQVNSGSNLSVNAAMLCYTRLLPLQIASAEQSNVDKRLLPLQVGFRSVLPLIAKVFTELHALKKADDAFMRRCPLLSQYMKNRCNQNSMWKITSAEEVHHRRGQLTG